MIVEHDLEQVLKRLDNIEQGMKRRKPNYQTVPVSDVLSFTIDYKERHYLFAWSAVALTLNAGAQGTFSLPAEVWYPLFFREGMQLTTSGQGNTAVLIELVATDDLIDTLFLSSLPAVNIASQPASSTATPLTSVNAANADTPLLAANANRKGAYFFNDSTATLYLSYGTTAASATSYTVQVSPQGFFEMPTTPVYTNQVRGFWSAANGAVRITELS
jgi:hypothetical protein